MRSTLFLMHFLCHLALALTPERPDANKVPDLAGESNWGTITQQGRKLVIDGNSCWQATGHIRDDDKSVYLLWVVNDGRAAPGVYKIDGKKLVGTWGYIDQVQILEDGSLAGAVHDETIWPLGN